MAKLELNIKDHESHIFRCDCWDWHFISLEWDDFDEDWRTLDFIEVYHPTRWRDRIVAAYKMLRGKRHVHSGIILDEEKVQELVKVMTK